MTESFLISLHSLHIKSIMCKFAEIILRGVPLFLVNYTLHNMGFGGAVGQVVEVGET